MKPESLINCQICCCRCFLDIETLHLLREYLFLLKASAFQGQLAFAYANTKLGFLFWVKAVTAFEGALLRRMQVLRRRAFLGAKPGRRYVVYIILE